ncbi:MAG: RNA methyltransferase [Sulfurovum sp.]|nr:RNA methyltransferase [Sulfurovum sp.]
MLTPQRLEKIDALLRRKQPDLQMFCDNVHSSQNISAIMRSCDGAGVLHFYYSVNDDKALRIHKTITQGAHRWIESQRVDTAQKSAFLQSKKEEGFQLVVTHLDEQAVSFRKIDYTKPTMIVVGNEKEGVSEEVLSLADATVVIPMRGMVQSLNVSVASALVLFEAERQRHEKGYYEHAHLDEKQIAFFKEKWIRRDLIIRRSKGWIMA